MDLSRTMQAHAFERIEPGCQDHIHVFTSQMQRKNSRGIYMQVHACEWGEFVCRWRRWLGR